ncbi:MULTISPECIES: dsRBD fold-containing protein [Streptacidiphilus]|uniref:dsRBD fold-containing protein n=1 Tax=Streptacidiphilus TaxID=228398 RepID=UPI0005A63598|nr:MULTISPECIES: dsRBD fold-containing protein [Streptacidiphilus]
MKTKHWTVAVTIDEDDARTEARAVMTDAGAPMATGRGVARRNPADRSVPDIGDELAVSRALEDLSQRLHDMASHDFAYLAGPAAR